jgi:two-component system, sensor histidine kinase and response regulator
MSGAAERLPGLDPTALSRLESLGGTALVAQIFGLVLEQGPQRLVKAWEGHRTGDPGAIRLAAHSMCSSAGNIGASRLLDLSRQVEDLAQEGEAAGPEMAGALAELEAEWQSIEAALENWRRRHA